jgi:hypothetical protein
MAFRHAESSLHVGALRRRSLTNTESNSIVFLERLPLATCWFRTSPTGSNDASERQIFHCPHAGSLGRSEHGRATRAFRARPRAAGGFPSPGGGGRGVGASVLIAFIRSSRKPHTHTDGTEGTGELINRSEGTTKETSRSAFEVERSAFASARWLAASRIEPQIARIGADNEPSELKPHQLHEGHESRRRQRSTRSD